ncbi:MAG: transporter substrate-binding domain-containing protein [Clostridia bacterium]|nr:transporter substrate-binding domain-containing protein [Clostridia bacterium]
MKKKNAVVIVLLVLAAAAAVVLLTARGMNGKILNAGIRTDITDWSLYDPVHGDAIGIEADIAVRLAKKAGYAGVRYVPVTRDTGAAALMNGDADCVICAYLPEDPAADGLAYSKAYYGLETVIIAKKSTLFTSVQDLAGRPVGVLAAENKQAEQLLTAVPDAVLITVPDHHRLSAMLETGEISAVCVPDDIAYMLQDDDCVRLEPAPGKQEVAMAARQDAPAGNALTEAMNALIDDGTVNGILSRWE